MLPRSFEECCPGQGKDDIWNANCLNVGSTSSTLIFGVFSPEKCCRSNVSDRGFQGLLKPLEYLSSSSAFEGWKNHLDSLSVQLDGGGPY